ncbi:hypothetical protein PLEOSDRAFT_1050203, partial [Pleurotus ostreatus PC15]
RIKAVLEAKLNETGWKDQVKDQAKEQARQMEDLSFQVLLDKIKPTAEGKPGFVPPRYVLNDME